MVKYSYSYTKHLMKRFYSFFIAKNLKTTCFPDFITVDRLMSSLCLNKIISRLHVRDTKFAEKVNNDFCLTKKPMETVSVL